MDIETIKNIIQNSISLDQLDVTFNHHHINIVAVGDVFINLSRLKRQQLIYQPLTPYILNKQIHALEIKTYTNDEWKNI